MQVERLHLLTFLRQRHCAQNYSRMMKLSTGVGQLHSRGGRNSSCCFFLRSHRSNLQVSVKAGCFTYQRMHWSTRATPGLSNTSCFLGAFLQRVETFARPLKEWPVIALVCQQSPRCVTCTNDQPKCPPFFSRRPVRAFHQCTACDFTQMVLCHPCPSANSPLRNTSESAGIALTLRWFFTFCSVLLKVGIPYFHAWKPGLFRSTSLIKKCG